MLCFNLPYLQGSELTVGLQRGTAGMSVNPGESREDTGDLVAEL